MSIATLRGVAQRCNHHLSVRRSAAGMVYVVDRPYAGQKVDGLHR